MLVWVGQESVIYGVRRNQARRKIFRQEAAVFVHEAQVEIESVVGFKSAFLRIVLSEFLDVAESLHDDLGFCFDCANALI